MFVERDVTPVIPDGSDETRVATAYDVLLVSQVLIRQRGAHGFELLLEHIAQPVLQLVARDWIDRC